MIGKVVENLVNAKQPQSDFVKLMDSFKDPYLVLIACILSLRTNDRTTYPATLRMLELAKTPQEMMRVEEDELAKAIYPVGFYKNKAKNIISKNLRKYRELANITQINLSIKIQKSSEYVSRIERGVMLPGVEVLYEIADILDIDPCLLISNK